MIGFRLDPDNPREAQALEVLARWQEQGYSIRHTLTEALVRLEMSEQEHPLHDLAETLHAMTAALDQVGERLDRLQRRGFRATQSSEGASAALSEAFIASVRNAAKAGLGL